MSKCDIERWPVPLEDQVAGNYRCINNQIIVRLLDDPWASSIIIRPVEFDDSRHLSMVVQVLARGGGYKKKRKTVEYFAEGSKIDKKGVGNFDQKGNHPYYVGGIHVGSYYFLKHPWIRDQEVKIKRLEETHPDVIGLFSEDKVGYSYDNPKSPGMPTGKTYSCFMISADLLLAELVLEEGETEQIFSKIQRGDMINAA